MTSKNSMQSRKGRIWMFWIRHWITHPNCCFVVGLSVQMAGGHAGVTPHWNFFVRCSGTRLLFVMRQVLRRRTFWKKESKLNYAFENPGWKVTRWRWCPEAQESGSDCDVQFHHAQLINPSTLPHFACPLPVHHCVTCSDLKPSTVIGQGERPATFTVLPAHAIRSRHLRTVDHEHTFLRMCGRLVLQISGPNSDFGML